MGICDLAKFILKWHSYDELFCDYSFVLIFSLKIEYVLFSHKLSIDITYCISSNILITSGI